MIFQLSVILRYLAINVFYSQPFQLPLKWLFLFTATGVYLFFHLVFLVYNWKFWFNKWIFKMLFDTKFRTKQHWIFYKKGIVFRNSFKSIVIYSLSITDEKEFVLAELTTEAHITKSVISIFFRCKIRCFFSCFQNIVFLWF